MQTGNLTRYLDKHTYMALNHLFQQSRTVKNTKLAIKRPSPLLTFQNNFTNILNSILEKQVLWGPCAEIKQFLEDNIIGYNSAVAVFQDIFGISRAEAKLILEQYPIFKEIPKKTIFDNYNKLRTAGLTLATIQSNIKLLVDDCDTLQRKIELVQRIVDDMKYSVCFFYHDSETLERFIQLIAENIKDSSNKKSINYFQEHLQINNEKLCNIVSKYIYIATQHPEQFVKKIKLLLDHKVSGESILRNTWPIHFSYEKMESRLEKYSENEIPFPVTPWILLCSEETFNRKIETSSINKAKSEQLSLLINFLSKNSGYSKTVIQFKLLNIQLKLSDFNESKKRINIIINEGYDFHDIIWSIKVLTLPETLIVDRFAALNAIEYKAPFLNILLLSDKDFVNYVNNNKKV